MIAVIPPAPAPAAPAPAETQVPAAAKAGAHTHTVAKGETLYSLALHFYGKGSRWPDIVAANRDQLTGSSPALKPGMGFFILMSAGEA